MNGTIRCKGFDGIASVTAFATLKGFCVQSIEPTFDETISMNAISLG
jgi:hypothetical protein